MVRILLVAICLAGAVSAQQVSVTVDTATAEGRSIWRDYKKAEKVLAGTKSKNLVDSLAGMIIQDTLSFPGIGEVTISPDSLDLPASSANVVRLGFDLENNEGFVRAFLQNKLEIMVNDYKAIPVQGDPSTVRIHVNAAVKVLRELDATLNR